MPVERSSASDLEIIVPIARTTWLRHFVPWQLIRFALINLRMLKMIGLSHAHHVDPE